jgi:DHA1 family bicyclomycin/chloramphenicol resistance-like MFS transporter
MAGMFAYISGSPFVFIERYGVAPAQYGWLFGLNALGLILASQLNRWLLARYPGGAILAVALAVHVAAGLALVLVAALELGGLAGLLGPLFFSVASLGLVQPNATAAAMARYGRAAGSASALLGTLQSVIAAGAGALVGALHDGTALPMAGVIAACGVAGFLSLYLLRSSPAAQEVHAPQ